MRVNVVILILLGLVASVYCQTPEAVAVKALQEAAFQIETEQEMLGIESTLSKTSKLPRPTSQKATNASTLRQRRADLLVTASQLIAAERGLEYIDRLKGLNVDTLLRKAGLIEKVTVFTPDVILPLTSIKNGKLTLTSDFSVIRRKRQYAGTDPSEFCLPKPSPCVIDKRFRTITGWCNNLQNPSAGSTMSLLRTRHFKDYNDGLNEPRRYMFNGEPLPSARLISNNYLQEAVNDTKPLEHLHMLFGQFIAHDVILMPTSTNDDGSALDCTPCNSGQLNPNCHPIPIPAGDPYFPAIKNRCMRLTRGANGQETFGPRRQLNQNSHHLDLSVVYGSNDCDALELRTFSGGKLRFYTFQGTQLPPQDLNDANCQSSPQYPCFKAGDLRNSLHPGLIVLHTAFIKQHNKIAAALQGRKPAWSDEQLYQTRRIMIAWYQNIVYGEYLPQLLGPDYVKKFELGLIHNAYYLGYQAGIEASISDAFGAAAFRFGHSQARADHWRTNNAQASVAQPLNHGNNTFYADQCYDTATGHINSLAEGFQAVPTRRVDQYFSFSMRNQLFEIRNQPASGVDLAAVNIQRGRDLGLPSYNEFRYLAGLGKADDWPELTNIGAAQINALKKLYAYPDDIDLYVGILSEKREPGSLLGKVGSYLIADQFYNLKRGDRFYFENQNSVNYEAFTLVQLNHLRTLSLHKMLCDNIDGMVDTRGTFDFTLAGRLEALFGVVRMLKLISWSSSALAFTLMKLLIFLLLPLEIACINCGIGIWEDHVDNFDEFMVTADCDGVCADVTVYPGFLLSATFAFCASHALVDATGRNISECPTAPTPDLCFCDLELCNDFGDPWHKPAPTQQTAISCFEGISLHNEHIYSGGYADCFGNCMRVRMDNTDGLVHTRTTTLYTCAPPTFCAQANVTMGTYKTVLYYYEVCCSDEPNSYDPLSRECPVGWIKSSVFKKCYYATIFDAAAGCRALATFGTLTSVANAFENSEIANLIGTTWTGTSTSYRIGLTRILGGNWTWQDYTDVSYTNWETGAEDMTGDTVIVDTKTLKWRPHTDFEALPFVCSTEIF